MKPNAAQPALKALFYVLSLSFLALFGFPFILTLLMSFKSQAEYMSGNYWASPVSSSSATTGGSFLPSSMSTSSTASS
jgi:ABC-type glycerol-3-phosphate transport system permease component